MKHTLDELEKIVSRVEHKYIKRNQRKADDIKQEVSLKLWKLEQSGKLENMSSDELTRYLTKTIKYFIIRFLMRDVVINIKDKTTLEKIQAKNKIVVLRLINNLRSRDDPTLLDPLNDVRFTALEHEFIKHKMEGVLEKDIREMLNIDVRQLDTIKSSIYLKVKRWQSKNS